MPHDDIAQRGHDASDTKPSVIRVLADQSFERSVKPMSKAAVSVTRVVPGTISIPISREMYIATLSDRDRSTRISSIRDSRFKMGSTCAFTARTGRGRSSYSRHSRKKVVGARIWI
jgi:hypothetical protein